ncbi:hypothetical protein [Granulicella sibirica]|uniref:hypothetical protein n=1 Tax=Granulicella sibirica TaxID=2479048 RepID=UPI0010088874|nr:hypothetical protein [Granulicella sibirica]
MTAVGALATMTSGGVTFFMSENRLVGYLLAGTSLVLWALIALLRSMHLGGRYFKLGLLMGVVAAGLGSPALLWYTYEHPAPKAPVTQVPPPPAVAPSQTTENSSHNTYKNSATGANSPVVTGDNAVVIIGNSDDQGAQRAKKRK